MSTLTEIVDGIVARLRTIEGLEVYGHVPGTAEFPAAFVMPPPIDYRQAMGAGVVRMDFEVVVLVGAFESAHQTNLFPYLDVTGSWSVLAAVDADRTLGLTDVDCVVLSSRPLGLEEISAYRAWGVSFQLLVAFTN